MNGPIRKVSIFVACLMAALLVNLTVLVTYRQPGLLDHPLNRRVRDAEFARDRGAILVGNDPIALSERSGNSTVPYRRSFTDGPLWAPVTGWFTRAQGASGLELSYARDLAGTASEQTFTRIVDVSVAAILLVRIFPRRSTLTPSVPPCRGSAMHAGPSSH